MGPAGTQAFINLDGFRWLQGTQSQNRIGKYIYLKRTTMNLQIQMDPLSRHGETKFRVIVYKSKRNAVIGTGGGNPMDNLIITQTGSTVGINNGSSYRSTFNELSDLASKQTKLSYSQRL